MSLITLVSIIFFSKIINAELRCELLTDCNSCIQKPGCTWCADLERELPGHRLSSLPRCNNVTEHEKNCKRIEKAEGKFRILDQRQSEAFRPDSIELNLSVGHTLTIDVVYTEGENKPVDLYFLMDLSQTMEDDRKNVSDQGALIAQALEKLTSAVRLGFGSFIDKPTAPFVSSSQVQGSSKYAATYSFRNHLSLTNNIDQFISTVSNARISINLDAPEGGLDALMQVVVCPQIGWRGKARKVVVLATDGLFHIAGDGKVGGVVLPNDEECHLNELNEYTHALKQDYPSVAQINSKVTENQIYTIFAVTEYYLPLYTELSNYIGGSAAAQIQGGSENIVSLIKEQYQNISETVVLTVNRIPAYLGVVIKAKCPGSKRFEVTSKCSHVKVGKIVPFQIEFTLLRCPHPNETPLKNIQISTFELSKKDGITVHLNYLCECGCKNFQAKKTDLEKYCNGFAIGMECGQCVCDSDHRGRNCECSRLQGQFYNQTNCQKDPTEPSVCSNRGECECGQCECYNDSGFSGKFCECDINMCKLQPQSSLECEGRGFCACNQCRCHENYDGPVCQCENSEKSCIEPLTDTICNGHGVCECNVEYRKKICQCDSPWSGFYCNKCSGDTCQPSQRQNRCGEPALLQCLRDCIANHTNEQGERVCHCSAKNEVSYNILLTLAALSDQSSSEVFCSFPFNSTCSGSFLYWYTPEFPNILQVKSSTLLVCQIEAPIIWFVLGVIGSVIFIGILSLLIWKLATYIHDRREFTKFEKERANANWDASENPLYNSPLQTFDNPGYRE